MAAKKRAKIKVPPRRTEPSKRVNPVTGRIFQSKSAAAHERATSTVGSRATLQKLKEQSKGKK